MLSEQLLLESEVLEYEISEEFHEVGAAIDHLSSYVEMFGEDNLLDYMVELCDENENIFSIYYLTIDNDMMNSSGYSPPLTIDFRNRIWYTSALETEGINYSPAFLNASEDKMIVTISKAVYTDSDILLGVIAADINIITIQSLISNKDVGEAGYAFLIDSNNNILAHPSIDLNELELLSSDTITSDISGWVESGVITNFEIDSIQGTIAQTQIVNNSYKLVLFIPNQEYNEVNIMVFTIFLVLAGVLLAVVSILRFLNHAFVYNPFNKLLKDIDSIDIDSNLDYRLSLENNEGFNEIRKVLNDTLNTTAQYFKHNREIHRELLYEHQKVLLLMDSTADIIFEIDVNKTFVSVYGKGLIKLKKTTNQFLSKSVLEVFGEEGIDRNNIYDNVLNGVPSVYDWKTKVNGVYLYFESSLSPIFDDNDKIVGAVGISRDITEAKLKQDEINFLNYHDYLTELHNRRYYFEQFKLLNKIEYLPLGVMMLDMNGLKIINDAFGHSTGDLALKAIGNILRETFEQKDIVSRIGGDEFAVLLPNTSSSKLEEYKNHISSTVKTLKIENVEQSLAIGFVLIKNIEDVDGSLKFAENQMYRHKTIEGTSFRRHAINAILKTLTDKYSIEREHSQRVSQLSKLIGMELHLMREDEIKELEQAGLFHDIGKISIPDNILNKTGKLTEKEYDTIKTHTEVGYQILRAANEYSDLAIHALNHHECWDGSGYPSGLKGKDIPLFSRIICIADAYDAMTSDRPYRKKMSKEYAVSEIIRCSGTQFDPKIAKIFVEKVLSNQDKK
jgi:diguanylate cyclase (GGDEF)-like protein/PAS domain S-box-containing protein